MLAPVRGPSVVRVINTTHPEFAALTAAHAQACGEPMMLLRGTEGEPVADPRRQPRMDMWIAGQMVMSLCVPAQDGVLTEMPLLPRTNDAATTAVYIQGVASGEKPAPAPLERQVECLVGALAALRRGGAQAGGRLASTG
jgi:anthranilate phosphoribosyltransferase